VNDRSLFLIDGDRRDAYINFQNEGDGEMNRQRCRFWVGFVDQTVPNYEITESYCVDRAEALSQAREIFANEVADIYWFEVLK